MVETEFWPWHQWKNDGNNPWKQWWKHLVKCEMLNKRLDKNPGSMVEDGGSIMEQKNNGKTMKTDGKHGGTKWWNTMMETKVMKVKESNEFEWVSFQWWTRNPMCFMKHDELWFCCWDDLGCSCIHHPPISLCLDGALQQIHRPWPLMWLSCNGRIALAI